MIFAEVADRIYLRGG